MSEALPLYVTALLPFLVLPLTGIADGNKAASAYYSPTIFLFIGGAFLALAIERTGLHRRLALFIMGLSGHKALAPAARGDDGDGDSLELHLEHLHCADHDADGARHAARGRRRRG